MITTNITAGSSPTGILRRYEAVVKRICLAPFEILLSQSIFDLVFSSEALRRCAKLT
jgi:hypothetical protein